MARHENLAVGELTLTDTPTIRDANGNKVLSRGSSLPSGAGYAVGGIFIKTGSRPGVYVNTGTALSATFVPADHTALTDWAIVDGGTVASAGGDATELISQKTPTSAALDLFFAGHSTTNDTDDFLSQIVTNTQIATIVATADPSTVHAYDWFRIRQGGKPIYEIVAAGNFTTAGGDATESITAAAVAVGDLVLVQVKTKGATPRYVAAAVAAAGAITVTLSGDPSTDHVLSYLALRPAGSFTPSHYIYKAGSYTSVGGAAAEDVTVSGVVATDIAFAVINTTNDTDVLVRVTAGTGKITIEESADPLTAHKWSYLVLRAFA